MSSAVFRTNNQDDDAKASTSEERRRSLREQQWWNVPRECIPWILSTLLSMVYLVALLDRVRRNDQDDHGLQNGFCVWGSHMDTGICDSETFNSHQFSWYIDLGMAVVAVAVGSTVFYSNLQSPLVGNRLVPAATMGIAMMILLHGYLHKTISHGVICDGKQTHCWQECHDDDSDSWHALGLVGYMVYDLGLVCLVLHMARLSCSWSVYCLLVCGMTSLMVGMGLYLGPHWALSAVFCQSHILASMVGVVVARRTPSSGSVTPRMGWWFLAATVVGLVEFMACREFLLRFYGHVWYDLVLHVAMIVSLLPVSTNHKSAVSG